MPDQPPPFNGEERPAGAPRKGINSPPAPSLARAAAAVPTVRVGRPDSPAIVFALLLEEKGPIPLRVIVDGNADEQRLANWLSRPETRERLSGEFAALLERVGRWTEATAA